MSLDPQAKALLDKLEAAGTPPLNAYSPQESRVVYDKASELARGTPAEPHAIETLSIPGPGGPLRTWLYRPSAEDNLPLLLYFHGGGYTIGSLESHDVVCRALCVEAHCLVAAVDYRLAPEHKYPAAVEDSWAALNWLADQASTLGADPARIAVGGDSAGGNLATVLCLKARDAGAPGLVFQLLIYPGTDMSCDFPSHREFASGYRLTSELIDWFYGHYFSPDDDTSHWQASPLNAPDHENLPPALVLSAGFDPLQDEERAYADKLAAAGVAVDYRHYPSMIHGFITMPGLIDEAGRALSDCAGRLRQAFEA